MPEPIIQAIPGTVRLEAIAAGRAARLGKSVQQMLADDREAMRQSTYPGAECLNPQEIEGFFANLPEERLLHVEACPMCMALVEAAQPTEQRLEHFLEECRRAQNAVAAASPATALSENPVRRPLIDIMSVEAPVLVAVAVVAAVAFGRANDATMTNLLATIAPQSLATVAAAALLVTLLAVAVAKWLKLGKQAPYQRFGGAAIGGVFAASLLIYGAKLSFDVNAAYSGLETGQSALLAALAVRHGDGRLVADVNPTLQVMSSPDGSLIIATSPSFDGKLIARTEQNGIDVYWELGKRRSLGTIYQGIVDHSGNGQVNVLVGTKKVSIESSLLWQAPFSGARVLAWVPADSPVASKIVPLDEAPKIESGPSAGHK